MGDPKARYEQLLPHVRGLDVFMLLCLVSACYGTSGKEEASPRDGSGRATDRNVPSELARVGRASA